MITVNMAKAIEIKKDMVRYARKPLLEALDVEMMRALEAQDTQKIEEIKAKKQALRDCTTDACIVNATTPEELKAAIPAALVNGV